MPIDKPLLLMVCITLFLFIIKWFSFPSYGCWYLYLFIHIPPIFMSVHICTHKHKHTHSSTQTHSQPHMHTHLLFRAHLHSKINWEASDIWNLAYWLWWIWINTSKIKLSLFSWDRNPWRTGNLLNFYIIAGHPYERRSIWENPFEKDCTLYTHMKYG